MYKKKKDIVNLFYLFINNTLVCKLITGWRWGGGGRRFVFSFHTEISSDYILPVINSESLQNIIFQSFINFSHTEASHSRGVYLGGNRVTLMLVCKA